jgi:hypothetical protein
LHTPGSDFQAAHISWLPPRHVDRFARRPCNYTPCGDQRPCLHKQCLHGQVPTRLALARRYLCPMVLRRVWGKKQRPRRNGNDRQSTSMALPVAMRAVATLALLLAMVLPAAAQPLRPALKQAQCPVGSMQSGGYCTPMLRNAPPSTEKRGLVLRSPLIPRKALPLTLYPPLE